MSYEVCSLKVVRMSLIVVGQYTGGWVDQRTGSRDDTYVAMSRCRIYCDMMQWHTECMLRIWAIVASIALRDTTQTNFGKQSCNRTNNGYIRWYRSCDNKRKNARDGLHLEVSTSSR